MGYQGETWGINSVELHPQPSQNYRHSVDGAVVGGRFTLAHLKWSSKRSGNGQVRLFQPEQAPFFRDGDARHKCRTTRILSSLRKTDVIRVPCCSGALLLGMLF